MNDPLATYLHDHLAGAVHAVDLLENMRDHYAGEPLGAFAAGLLVEIKADVEVLRALADRAGAGSSPLKEMSAWLGEKISRLKLSHEGTESLGTFEALEFLVLGIHGKWALWEALAAAAPDDTRLQGTDFAHLSARAAQQHDQVNERRLELARTALHRTPWDQAP